MTGYTTRGKLPYPSGTDPVSGGAAAIKALAEANDARFSSALHANPAGANLPAGGGTLGYIPQIVVPALSIRQLALILWRGTVTSNSGTDTAFVLRDVTGAAASIAYARVGSTANASASGAFVVWPIAANAAPKYDVVLVGSAAATGTADARFGGLDILLFGIGN